MTNSEISRRASRIGLNINQCKRGTMLSDPLDGGSLFYGNSNRRSWQNERKINAFLSKREKGGLR